MEADPIARLVAAFRQLPGIGEKTAQRLAFHVLKQPADLARELAEALKQVKEQVRECSVCSHLSGNDPCTFCRDERRDGGLLCVVAQVPDLFAVERSGFRGRYHVLHGVLAPLDGVGPEQLRIQGLVLRVAGGGVREVIVATSPTVEGETTALYLHKMLTPLGVAVTRIATGVPTGGDLEYTDQTTLSRALEGRRQM